MKNPVSTYRLQFNKDFTFKHLEEIIPYLKKLGVGSIYASPIFRSTQGSSHGYDGVDPNRIDPEIGTLEELENISAILHGQGIGWVQDIVPNHMAFHSENAWLMDVLEKGTLSAYSTFFDVAWNSRLFRGKLIVPFLEFDLDEVLEKNKISVQYVGDRFCFKYEDATYPLNPESYVKVLESSLLEGNQSLGQLSEQIRDMESVEEPQVYLARWNEIRLQLTSIWKNDSEKSAIDARMSEINGDQIVLRQLLDLQTYALCSWKKTDQHINFRRFFTVNDLICLNIQNDEVFEKYHLLTSRLIQDGVFQGLRIDHIDGLYDPQKYLEKVREMAGPEAYILVEKILEKEEELPVKWPIEGTTGYEFLSWLNNLLTQNKSETAFTDFYQSLVGDQKNIQEQLLEKKAIILYEHMAGELQNLSNLFIELELLEKDALEEIGATDLKKIIAEFLIHFPVYRYYGNALPLEDDELVELERILDTVIKSNPSFKDKILLIKQRLVDGARDDVGYGKRLLEFYQRCMQFTGPLMAKGGEDTLMYSYNRFIGHNEVGDSPINFGLSQQEFHRKMIARQKNWPLALNSTSTHDTKRGEDIRARLNVLTDLPDEWFARVQQWREMNGGLRGASSAPDVNDEYLIYQMLIGSFPMPGEDEDDFGNRFEAFLQKALREAKVNSNWSAPNEEYESGCQNFSKQLLESGSPFWKDFSGFHEKISNYGIVNSLTQVLLKFTCPGTPDTYQGCELWDLNMVDPDNRRAVNFTRRNESIDGFGEEDDRKMHVGDLWKRRFDGQIKLWITRQLSNLRGKYSTLFAKGDYIPLIVEGALKEHVIAFARAHDHTFLIVAAPLNSASLCETQGKDLSDLDWMDTRIVIPPHLGNTFEHLLTGDEFDASEFIIPSNLFAKLPVAVLQGYSGHNREVI